MDRVSDKKTRARRGFAMITITYFAKIKELTGKEQEVLPITTMTVQEIKEWVSQTYIGFSQYASSVLVALNEEYALPEDRIQSGDIVAFIPPVSGG
jgi:molybdopterin synthase sulfur carrier subunit